MSRYLKCCGINYKTPVKRRLENYKGYRIADGFYIESCDKCGVYLSGFIGYDKAEGQTKTLPRYPETGLYQCRGKERHEWASAILTQGYQTIELQDDKTEDEGSPTRGIPLVGEYTMRCGDKHYLQQLEYARLLPNGRKGDPDAYTASTERRPVIVV